MALVFDARKTQDPELADALDELLDPKPPLDGDPDVAFLFVSPHFFGDAEKIGAEVRTRTRARRFLGCGGGSIIADDEELEDRPAMSLLLAWLPGAVVDPLRIEPDAAKDWASRIPAAASAEPGLVLLPDPFSVNVIPLIDEFNRAFPGATVCGGLASGGPEPGTNLLFLEDQVYHGGTVGLALSGSVRLRAVVSQGCRPVGRRFIVTRAEDQIVQELSGKPALERLQEVVTSLKGKDRQLAKDALFVGRAMSEQKTDFHRGDFLIRNLMGIDPRSGAVAVGDQVRRGITVQFHVRDAETALEDLHATLTRYKTEQRGAPRGALLFSCLGRGAGMYGEAHRDVGSVAEVLGHVPKAGFFCSGEIGPIAGTNFVHGFTLSSCFFEER